MPKKSRMSRNRSKRGVRGVPAKTRKQKIINMIGCSKKHKHSKSCKNKKVLGNSCPNCGVNCHCGPNCNCPHPCPGTCYLNRRMKKQKGGSGSGSGCGACGCPKGGLSYQDMNKFGGSYPDIFNKSVIIEPPRQRGSSMILGIGQNGGSCNVCSQVPVVSQSGGNFFKQIGAMPGPFTGSAWEPNKLPGDDGISGNRNFLKSYAGSITNDPALKMSMNAAGYNTMNSKVGGYRYNRKNNSSSHSLSKSKKGGGLIPQDLVNLGRDFTHNFKSAYNALNGFPAPVDPAPYKDQLTGVLNNNRFMV